ncbi:hypothetical protein C9I57_13135 [Trinickia symbiotica]|uniref:Uncharacterized protein n=1 Tax=Trinickia symbiotica TaxID=863227 RepID=A0A2T3XU43_9BURK|nr:hypothetical protein C9I57_13135 [Trinickia symbiotica]
MDSWQRQLAIGVLILSALALASLLPGRSVRIELRVLVIGFLSLLLILPVVIFLLVALSLGSTI